MTSHGIYTLANDVVFDQLVALLNSIEANVDRTLPVCIIPYDDRLDRIKREIKSRSNVTLFENQESIDRWDNFAARVWQAHSRASYSFRLYPKWYKGHLQRKFVAFDGDFDEFVFYEADSLAMKPIDGVFAKLKNYDLVFDDWEHKKKTPFAALNIPLIEATKAYTEAQIRAKLHCGSFFAGKRSSFDDRELRLLERHLVDRNEVEWINGRGWWDDVYLFNYLTLRSDRSLYNFTLSPNPQDRTGNCADADSFVKIDNILYNEQGLKPIHRIHYMNYSAADFAYLTQGKDVRVRYQDIFLTYRFWKQPEQKPQTLKPSLKLTKQLTQLRDKFKKVAMLLTSELLAVKQKSMF
jgi:hypothetical protein